MKKKFLISILCVLVLHTSSVLSQQELLYKTEKSTEFRTMVLDAHHTYQHATFEKANETRRKYGKNSTEFKNILLTDSIFKAARGNINSLLYNMDELNSENHEEAIKSIMLYVNQAKEIETASKITKSKMDIATSKIIKVNNNISTEYRLELNGKISKISPNNSMEIHIKFDFAGLPENRKNYCVYLFPTNWIYLEDRLYQADKESWANIGSYYTVLEKYAHRWVYGMENRIQNIYTGKFTLLIVDRNKNLVLHFQEILIPANKLFEFTVTN